MAVVIGSARADENYKYSGGRRGDQRQKSSYDTTGEVSMQSMYTHSKGWYILRLKNTDYANANAKAMKDACNNDNIGYSQSDRLSIFEYKSIKNKAIRNKVNCDCSSLVRKCIYDATGKDVGNFTTYNEADVLEKSGLFEKRKEYKTNTKLYDGDVLVTKTQGHTVIVVSGNQRISEKKSITTTSTATKSSSTSKITYTIGKKYTVKASGLNMRTKPDTSAKVVTVLNKSDVVTCKTVKNVDGATWISNGAGWVCAITKSGKVYVG